ncbi:MAG: tautomerase family protein [Hyphomicrobiales bacterium]|nr:tautomerase family protein [Hyphomicrobiales bacterium]
MPLVRIATLRNRTAEETRLLADGVYDALRATFAVPEDDRFVLVDRHAESGFAYGATYMGMERSDDLVIVQITCNDGRTLDQKRALYAAITDNFGRAGVGADDVFINLVEVRRENWSFGRGLAQYA